MGVIAHEAGHITAGHLVRMHQNLATAKNISIAGLILGLPLAVVTGEPDALLASQQLSQQIATRSFWIIAVQWNRPPIKPRLIF